MFVGRVSHDGLAMRQEPLRVHTGSGNLDRSGTCALRSMLVLLKPILSCKVEQVP